MELQVIDKPAEVEKPQQKVAVFIRKLDGWNGNAELYKMYPPFAGNEYIILSSIDLAWDVGKSETAAFGATLQGEAAFVDLLRYNPAKDHASVLKAEGYIIE